MGRVVSRNRGASAPQSRPALLNPCLHDRSWNTASPASWTSVSGPLCRSCSPKSRGSNHGLRLTSPGIVRPGWSLSLLKKILKPKMPLAKVRFLFQRMGLLGKGGMSGRGPLPWYFPVLGPFYSNVSKMQQPLVPVRSRREGCPPRPQQRPAAAKSRADPAPGRDTLPSVRQTHSPAGVGAGPRATRLHPSSSAIQKAQRPDGCTHALHWPLGARAEGTLV